MTVKSEGYSQQWRPSDTGRYAVTIRNLLTRRWAAATVIAAIALVTFAVPAWCVASGTWNW
jgi:hypothetical protein